MIVDIIYTLSYATFSSASFFDLGLDELSHGGSSSNNNHSKILPS